MQKILDDADRRILRELQRDSSRTVTEIADAVGLSHAPCWRRIQRLRSEGFILREAAVLDHGKAGWDLEVFVFLKVGAEARAHIHELRRAVIAHEQVIGAYVLLGTIDMMLHVVARSMRDFERFYMEHLSGKGSFSDINSMVVLSRLKDTEVPV